MSKVLIVKGADFSGEALDVVEFGKLFTLSPSFTSGGVMIDGANLALIPKVNIADRQSVVKSILLGQYVTGMKGKIIVLNSALDTILSESEEITLTGEKTDVSALEIVVPQGGYVGLKTVGAINNWHLNTGITPYAIVQVSGTSITPSAGTYGLDYGFEVFAQKPLTD